MVNFRADEEQYGVRKCDPRVPIKFRKLFLLEFSVWMFYCASPCGFSRVIKIWQHGYEDFDSPEIMAGRKGNAPLSVSVLGEFCLLRLWIS